MRGLVLDAPGHIRLVDDLPDPQVVDDTDAVVAVTAAGLCGSDLHPYEGRERVRTGVVQGHEIVGHVLATGAGVSRFAPGDHVLAAFTTSCGRCAFCVMGLTARCEHGALFGYGDPDDLSRPALHGGQAELVRVPLADSTLVAVPAGCSDADAVLLTDNLPTAWYAVERADIEPGSAVAVVGLGSVGLLAASAALRHAGSVVAVDVVADRRERANALGATALAPNELATMTQHFDAVIEAAGSPAAQRLAFTLVRPGGTLSVIAVQTDATFPFTPVEAYDRNLTLRAGRAPVRAIIDELLPLVERGAVSIPSETIVTHGNVALADGPQLYRSFAAREAGLVKALLRP